MAIPFSSSERKSKTPISNASMFINHRILHQSKRHLITIAQAIPPSHGPHATASIPVHDVSSAPLPARRRSTDLRNAFAGVDTARCAQAGDMARITHVPMCITVSGSEDIAGGRRRTRIPVLLLRGLRARARARRSGAGLRGRACRAGSAVLGGTGRARTRGVLIGV
jgi:hypothetical protein